MMLLKILNTNNIATMIIVVTSNGIKNKIKMIKKIKKLPIYYLKKNTYAYIIQ